jgi:Holliday junction DNA helicase RuvA
MYAYLEGLLVQLDPTFVVLDVQGVGYHLRVPLTTYEALKAAVNERVRLFVHLQVAEDAHTLYGFAAEEDKLVFQTMITVSGVGPAIGLMALSQMKAREVATAISTGNDAALTRIKGLGAKTAQRLTLELKTKMLKVFQSDPLSSVGAGAAGKVVPTQRDEALAALVTLGIARTAAEKSVDQLLSKDPGLSTEELIRGALKR